MMSKSERRPEAVVFFRGLRLLGISRAGLAGQIEPCLELVRCRRVDSGRSRSVDFSVVETVALAVRPLGGFTDTDKLVSRRCELEPSGFDQPSGSVPRDQVTQFDAQRFFTTELTSAVVAG